MSMNLTVDANKAREAGKFSERISEAGAYAGVITKAKIVTSQKGTTGLELAIKTAEDATAEYLTLWMQNDKGEELFGMKAVQALMVCLRLRECPTGSIKVSEWNKDANKTEEAVVNGYPAMMGKKVGVLLRKELYTKKQGGEGEQLIIVSFYEADTNYTASEILDKVKDPAQMQKALDWLLKNPVKDSRTTKGYASSPAKSGTTTKQSVDGFDDDIPY